MNTEPAQLKAPVDAWRDYTSVYQQLTGHLSRELTRATGLSEADYQVLDALLTAADGRARALELRWLLQWEKSRLSHHLGRMAARGLLARHDCIEDARSTDIVLTPAGRAAGLQARQIRAASLETLVFDALTPQHLAHLAEITTILAARLAHAAQQDPACQAAQAEAFPNPTAARQRPA